MSRKKTNKYGTVLMLIFALALVIIILAVALPKEDTPKTEKPVDFPGSKGYIILLEVKINDYDHNERTAEAVFNFTDILEGFETEEVFKEDSLKVVEVDEEGGILNENVPWQLDKADDYNEASNALGTLVFMLEGYTHAPDIRYYQVCFNDPEYSSNNKSLNELIKVEDGIDYKQQESYKISTANATYYYHKSGAGFAGIIDSDGDDWIGYSAADDAAGSDRGIPNLVYPEDVFSPGSNGCISRLISEGPLKVTIYSETSDGKWACTWDVYPKYATMTLIKADHPYWFAYEGTPGGVYDPETNYHHISIGAKKKGSEDWSMFVQLDAWMALSDINSKHMMFLLQHERDELNDIYQSADNMAVFAFGRNAFQPLMESVPSHFSIGFTAGKTNEDMSKSVYNVLRIPEVAVTGTVDRKN